jgi:hypothetical protein
MAMMTFDSFIEFAEQSKDGIWISGLVKAESTGDFIEFTRSQFACRWVQIHRSAIAGISVYGPGVCVDSVTGQSVQGLAAVVLLAQPTEPVAATFAALLKQTGEFSHKCMCTFAEGLFGTTSTRDS